MISDLIVPSPGESITEVVIATWLVSEGDVVEVDQELAEVESDKATLPLLAQVSGRIHLCVEGGATVPVGSVVCQIDDSVRPEEKKSNPVQPAPVSAKTAAPVEKVEKKEEKMSPPPSSIPEVSGPPVKVTPLAKARMKEYGQTVDDILSGMKRLGSEEVELVHSVGSLKPGGATPDIPTGSRQPQRVKMSQLRKKLAARLVAVKNQTAMLTTFNEVDMSACMALRKQFQEDFQKTHGVKLGFMSLFTKAVCEALRLHPQVNSMIDGDDLIQFPSCDIGIAVQTPKGLMVPVIRGADLMSLAEIEKALGDLAARARTGKISLDELSGGTFTITNGGVFGSLLSTPILNPPQSGILGMHNIVDRPVAVAGKVEIRPMMYLALSYDHRVIDGKDSVGFLVKVKEMIENPLKMLNGGRDPERILLGI